ncbi:putative porin [Thalassomonas viridans]|uniref:Porin n=1 Tax=Thalassomonas viridans TaxID=137584 RepID=A0AAE9Z343_9GAMM|nr:putative porin [Thalassomonas viridans]WDE04307.1 putative porin [Thalassomonas viridans]
MKLLPLSTLLLAGTSLLASAGLQAQEYQSISNAGYTKWDDSPSDEDAYSLGTKYYFKKKSTLGPLDEFEYINKTSNISANYLNLENSNDYHVAGELFMDQVLVGASYQYHDIEHGGSDDIYSLSLGYLISDDFLVKAEAYRKDSHTDYFYSASYNHQINDSDYFGFTFRTDEDFDARTLSSKYFKALGQDSYLTAGVSYRHNDDLGHSIAANAEYFFTSRTSIGGSYDDNDDYTVSAKHFFNTTYALEIGFKSNGREHVDYDIYTIDFSAQF